LRICGKEGIALGAFWDISENTSVDLEVIVDEMNHEGEEFHTHEPGGKSTSLKQQPLQRRNI
jgi:hypothetical protein